MSETLDAGVQRQLDGGQRWEEGAAAFATELGRVVVRVEEGGLRA